MSTRQRQQMPVMLAMCNPTVDELPMALAIVRLQAKDAKSWHGEDLWSITTKVKPDDEPPDQKEKV